MKPASQSPPPGPRARPQHPDCGRRALCQCPRAPGLASTLPDLKLPAGRATTGPKQEAPQRWPAPTWSVQGPGSPPIRPPAPPPQPKLSRTSVRWGSLWPPAPRRAVRQCGRGQPVLPSAEPMAPSLAGKGPGLWSLSPGCGSGGGHGRRWGRVGAGAAWGPEGAPPRAAPALYLGGSARAWGPRVQSLRAPSHLASVLGRPRSARPREDMAAPAPCELLRGGPVPLPPSLRATGSLGPSSARDTCPGQRQGRGHAGRTPMAADPRTRGPACGRPRLCPLSTEGKTLVGQRGPRSWSHADAARPLRGSPSGRRPARPPGPPQDAALLGTTPHQPAGLWPADERGLKARPHARAARVGGAMRSAGCPLTLGWGVPSASCP